MGSPKIYYNCAELLPKGNGSWEGGGYTAKAIYGMTVIQKDGKNVVIDLPEGKDLAKYASVFVEVGGKIHFFNSKGAETKTGSKNLEYYKKQLTCGKDADKGDGGSTAVKGSSAAGKDVFIQNPDKYLNPSCDMLAPYTKQDLIDEKNGRRFADGTCSYTLGGEVYLGTVEQCSAADRIENVVDTVIASWRPSICKEMKDFYNKKDLAPAKGEAAASCSIDVLGGLKIRAENKQACDHYDKAKELGVERDKQIAQVRENQIGYIKKNMRRVTDQKAAVTSDANAKDFGVFNDCDNTIMPPIGENNKLIELHGKILQDGTCIYATDEEASGKGGRKQLQFRAGIAEYCSKMDSFDARVGGIMASYRPKICGEQRQFYVKKDMPASSPEAKECSVSLTRIKISSKSEVACGHLAKASELRRKRDLEIEAVRKEQMGYIKKHMRKVDASSKEFDPSLKKGIEESTTKATRALDDL